MNLFDVSKRVVTTAFVLSIFGILLIEGLKYWPADSYFKFKAGEISLAFCYSISASYIFFYINDHLSIEKRRQKCYLYMHNKLAEIHRTTQQILHCMHIEFGNVTKETVLAAAKAAHPMTEVKDYHTSTLPFANWFEYLDYQGKSIQNDIMSLLVLSDLLDENLLQKLLLIEMKVRALLVIRKLTSNDSLDFLATDIFELYTYSRLASSIFMDKYLKYHEAHVKQFRVDNKKTNHQ